MRLKFTTWEDYHHQLYRIYHGIIAVTLLPFFMVFLELEVMDIKVAKVPEWISWIVLIVFLPACFYLSWNVWKGARFQYQLDESLSLKEKLVVFRKMEIGKYVWLEIVCVLALLGLWLTAHYLFVIAYFAVLAQFSFLRPSEDRVIRTLRLTKEDRDNLHNGPI